MIVVSTHKLSERLAAAWHERESLAGKRVGVTLSGGNVDATVFRDVLDGKC